MVGRAAVPPLPSQSTLLRQVQRQQLHEEGQGQPEQEPAPSVDQLMDELFSLEQKPAQPAEQQAPLAAQLARRAAAGQPAAKPSVAQLMDELAVLEQQADEQKQSSKRPRNRRASAGVPAAAAGDRAPMPSAVAAAAGAVPARQPAASAGASSGGLPPTQPAVGGVGAPAAPAAPPADPAALAGCCMPHKRVVAFVWAAVRSIVPAALLGDAHNRRVVRGAIR